MDEPVENLYSSGDDVVSWAPRPLLGAVFWVSAAAFAVLAVLTLLAGNNTGPILLGLAALATAALGCYTSFARPRLAADRTGLRIRTLLGTHDFGWAHVTAKVATTRRLGREVHTLEIDTGEHAPHLVVLGRLELDAEPADVLEAINRVSR